jgi:hypothetical protein
MPDSHLLPLPLLMGQGHHHFGPATVTAVLGSEVEAAIDGTLVLARLAVYPLYQPVAGDEVLLIASDDAAYVIGVLNATGPLTVLAPQDLRLWAPHGRIELMSASLVASADEIELHADRFSIVARHMRETFETLERVVRGLFDFEAGEVRARVQQAFSIFSRRFRASADEDVKIDGNRIDLG